MVLSPALAERILRILLVIGYIRFHILVAFKLLDIRSVGQGCKSIQQHRERNNKSREGARYSDIKHLIVVVNSLFNPYNCSQGPDTQRYVHKIGPGHLNYMTD